MTATFTPLFDEITQKYGIVTSAVYGYIWRKCQGERGVCNASYQTIADALGINRRTVINHVQTLVNEKLITDKTPNEKGKTHSYLVNLIHYTSESNSLGGESNSPVPVNLIHQTSESNSPKDTIRDNIRDKDIYIPAHDLNAEFQTALTQIAKEKLAPGFNEKKFEDAAFALIGWDAELSDIAKFGEWWKLSGWHNQKPALTNIVNHWQDFKANKNLKHNKNGQSSPPQPAVKMPTQAEIDELQAMISRGLA